MTHNFSIISMSYLPNEHINNLLSKLSIVRKMDYYFTVKSKFKTFLDARNWYIQGGDIQ